MERSEFHRVPDKIGNFGGSNFSAAQEDAWFEVLGEHTLTDALAAVVAFYSKPFKHHA